MTVTVKYFAWVREQIGIPEEQLELPAGTTTVADLISHLKTRGPEYEAAFVKPDVIRAAVDQTHAKHSVDISSAREVAFFPPVTGG